jgi:uncharacterized protein with NRDE domain
MASFFGCAAIILRYTRDLLPPRGNFLFASFSFSRSLRRDCPDKEQREQQGDRGRSSVCTLIAIHRRVHGAPLVVAANRDEYYDRPAEGPALRGVAGRGGMIVAPLDLRAGGTWLGVNAEGVFAAVTNLRNPSPDPSRRSRGMVVLDALREPTAVRGAEVLKALPEEAYNPFNCFIADREHAFRLIYRDVPRVRELSAGVHVIGNVDPEDEPSPKIERVRQAAEAVLGGSRDEVLEGLATVCREHETGGSGISDTCVHLDAYGTRSSAILSLADPPSESRLLFSDGPPCAAEYEDFSTLLHEHSQRACYGPGETAVRTIN